MLPPDQLSVPDKEDLRHRILFVHRKRNDILVLAVTVRNLLPLADLLDTSYQISSFCSILKAHFFRCFLHFFRFFCGALCRGFCFLFGSRLFSELIDRFLKISV